MISCVECAFPLWCASVFIDGPLAFKLESRSVIWRARYAEQTEKEKVT